MNKGNLSRYFIQRVGWVGSSGDRLFYIKKRAIGAGLEEDNIHTCK